MTTKVVREWCLENLKEPLGTDEIYSRVREARKEDVLSGALRISYNSMGATLGSLENDGIICRVGKRFLKTRGRPPVMWSPCQTGFNQSSWLFGKDALIANARVEIARLTALGGCYSAKTLKNRLKYSRDVVFRALDELVSEGVLKVVQVHFPSKTFLAYAYSRDVV